MLNEKPIILVGFARGGTNILLNILRSHPNVCSPRGETDQVFRGKGRFPFINEPVIDYISKFWNYFPILTRQKQDVFSPNLWEERNKFLPNTMEQIDKILYNDKLKALGPTQNLYKTQNVKYKKSEISNSRLLLKNLNGLIFLTDRFFEMYPDSTFIALVRNGFAICEGQIRRGADPVKAAKQYQKGCQKIILDSENYNNYFIFKFEDIINNPLESLEEIYNCSALNINAVKKIRLETKKVLNLDGKHEYIHNTEKKELIWYSLDEFGQHFDINVNDNQLKNLTNEHREIIYKHAQNALEFFSYA
jgi:hypothetical protein